MEQPILTTPRLILRPFSPADAPAVQVLASAREVAATSTHVPHPYPKNGARDWIDGHAALWESGQAAIFAVTRRESDELVGSISLGIDATHQRAELGYWIGVSFWNCGYATEAARAIMQFGFQSLKLRRIFASHFAENAASGRVQEKIGMKLEGTFRAHFVKWGQEHDAVFRGILAQEWAANRQ